MRSGVGEMKNNIYEIKKTGVLLLVALILVAFAQAALPQGPRTQGDQRGGSQDERNRVRETDQASETESMPTDTPPEPAQKFGHRPLLSSSFSGLNSSISRIGGVEPGTEEKVPFEPRRPVLPVEGGNLSDDDPVSGKRDRFHWKPALMQSGLFLGIKHGTRLFQKKTQRELGGPFFKDWGKSIRNLRGWNDGDSPFTNNFAHPLQGSVTGWIFINNSDRAKRQEFGRSKEYWKSRLKALAWSTAWSTQFEFGPVSEATIGNVGLREKNGHSTMAWTDLVLTPTVGTAFVIQEDIVDKYLLRNWIERKSKGVTTKVKILRSVLTPTASFSNLLRGKYPWRRDNR